MDRMTRRELKIFLTVFLLLGIFVQWYGMNANSRIDLTRSIVERGSFDIDPYRNNTGDRSYYSGHYYSDKAPGLSFLATPIYAVWNGVYSVFGDATVTRTPRTTLLTVNEQVSLSAPTAPGPFYHSLLLLVTWLTATAAVALLTILIYRLSGSILEEEWKRLLAAFGFAFGTLITHYGTLFLPAAAATLLAFYPFYRLYTAETLPDHRTLILLGAVGGFAVTLKVSTIIILAVNTVYAWKKFDRVPTGFVVGGFVGGLPYLLYNTIVFGAPWRLPRSFLDPVLWPQLQHWTGFILDPSYNLVVALRLLIFPYRGIFYWFPFLLLAVVGFRAFYREQKRAAAAVVTVFLGFLLMTSTWWAWWHGGWFGARLLVPTVPFLMIPLLYGIKHLGKKTLILLLLVSVSINLAGFQGGYEDMLKNRDASSQMSTEAQQKTMRPMPLADPIRDYYLSGFFTNGAQSRLLNGLYHGQIPPDIRAYSPYEERTPFLLLLWLLVLIPATIWRHELGKTLQQHREHVLAASS